MVNLTLKICNVSGHKFTENVQKLYGGLETFVMQIL